MKVFEMVIDQASFQTRRGFFKLRRKARPELVQAGSGIIYEVINGDLYMTTRIIMN